MADIPGYSVGLDGHSPFGAVSMASVAAADDVNWHRPVRLRNAVRGSIAFHRGAYDALPWGSLRVRLMAVATVQGLGDRP